MRVQYLMNWADLNSEISKTLYKGVEYICIVEPGSRAQMMYPTNTIIERSDKLEIWSPWFELDGFVCKVTSGENAIAIKTARVAFTDTCYNPPMLEPVLGEFYRYMPKLSFIQPYEDKLALVFIIKEYNKNRYRFAQYMQVQEFDRSYTYYAKVAEGMPHAFNEEVLNTLL